MEVSGMDKKYDFRKTEKELQDLWEEEGIYRYQNGRDRKVFSIDTPPPTVSGKLHIGHVFSYTQAEMIARYKRMRAVSYTHLDVYKRQVNYPVMSR